jgi:polysaccharide export outer membrane protein
MSRKVALLITLCLTAAFAVAQSTAPDTTGSAQTAASPSPGFQERTPRYQVQPGDVLDLTFDFSPEFNQTVSVQPDGFVSLRGAGDVHIAGETVPQISDSLRTAYSKILYQPAISVMLKDYEKPYFVADGQVGRPGKYDLRGDTTLVQAIAIAGGFNSAAKHSQVVLFRRVDSNWTEAKLIDVKKMENKRNLAEDMHLRPGDMIFVPKNHMSKIQQFLPNTGVGLNLVPGQF